ncbi:MAG: hypothetical protein JJU29_11545 [Verrucomicrobia bacterium]|nr:hypothetical protein [Verrucomicrobiota bacterium]MCH8512868.1 hypothetical protein [Kiritimatiellia bacterium]
MKKIVFAWICLVAPGFALVAPQDWVIEAPNTDLPNVRIVRTIGATDALRIESPTGEVLASFRQEELVSMAERSNFIAFDRKGALWMRGGMALHHQQYFVVRLAWGRLMVVDLKEARLLNPAPPPAPNEDPLFNPLAAPDPGSSLPDYPEELSEEIINEIFEKIDALAIANLSSRLTQERLIAVNVCAQRGLKEAIPKLRELARNDPAFHMVHTSNRPRDGRKVYFVREAAAEALEKLEP